MSFLINFLEIVKSIKWILPDNQNPLRLNKKLLSALTLFRQYKRSTRRRVFLHSRNCQLCQKDKAGIFLYLKGGGNAGIVVNNSA